MGYLYIVCVRACLSVEVISLYVGGYLGLPLVSVVEQLLLVVEQLFVRLCGKLKVGALYDSVHRTGLLTETTVDTFGHVDVIASCPPAAVRSRLRFNGDGLSWADSLTQLAGDAAFLS